MVPLLIAFRVYVGLQESRHIFCLHSDVVAADIKDSDTHQSRCAYDPSNTWFVSRQGQSIFFSAPGRPDRLWGPPSLLAFEANHLSSDEVAVDILLPDH
jgi:hypothetical protein